MNTTPTSSHPPAIRQTVLLLLGVATIFGSGPFSQYLLDHGYLDWAQYVSDWVFQTAGFALLTCLVVPMFIGLDRAKRPPPNRSPSLTNRINRRFAAGKT